MKTIQPSPGPHSWPRWAVASIVAAQVLADNFPNKPTAVKIFAELGEDADELADDAANWLRIVWSAACNIGEEEEPDCSEPSAPAKAQGA